MENRISRTTAPDHDRTMTPETAVRAGIGFGTRYGTVAVVRDSSPCGEMLSKALISGLLSAGSEVIDLGRTAVPVAHTALGTKCGLLLSVGDPDGEGKGCGIKAYAFDGAPIEDDEIEDVLGGGSPELPDYHKVRGVKTLDDADGRYIERVKTSGITSQGYIILDCGCGSTSSCAPRLLESIGADVVAFNVHTTYGPLPRSPGLAKTNLMNISNFVNASIGSVGIALNGDGTRLALMDESGKYVPGDRLLALMLMYLEPDVAVVPFDSPGIVEDAFRSPLGLRPHDKGGERKLVRAEGRLDAIIAAIKENNADFGALNDGTFVFPQLGYCPDALFASAVISELAGKRSIRNVLESIPVYSNRMIRIDFDGNTTLFSNRFEERIKNYDVTEVSSLDSSWKVLLKHGTYIIRQSRTDPKKLIVFAESYDVVYLITMLEQAKDIVNYCIGAQTSVPSA